MADLEATLRPYVDSGVVPGLVALIARGHDVRVEALGVQGTSGAPMRRDSIFRGASITKPLTAALAVALVEDGFFDLDDPVDELLPELAAPRVLRERDSELDDTVAAERPLTVRHLLTGTAGHGFATWESPVIGLLMEQLGQAADDIHDVPGPDEWMRRLGEVPLMHQPGEGWTYNASYDVLAVLLARAAAKGFAELMAERLLEPLGMVDTGFHVPADKLDRFTTLYSRDDAGVLQVSDEVDGVFTTEPAFASGSGGSVTTVDDWLAFGRMLLAGGVGPDGRILHEDSVRLMMTDHTTEQHRERGGFFLDGQGWGFGGGVDIELLEPWNVIGRYGWVGGTGTSAYVHPDGTVGVLLTQVGLADPAVAMLEAFWTATASSSHPEGPCGVGARR